MVFSRDAAIYGAPMRPDLSPLSSAKLALKGARKPSHLGIELALPATILAFIVLASQSPMLKVELDNVLDWFVKNDQYFWGLTAIILALPLRMIASMILERKANCNNVFEAAPADGRSVKSASSDPALGPAA